MSCSTTRCYCSTLYGCWSRGRMTSTLRHASAYFALCLPLSYLSRLLRRR